MKLLPMKEVVFRILDTRANSLSFIFLKLLKRLMLTRFHPIVKKPGIIHDSQSPRSMFTNSVYDPLLRKELIVLDRIRSIHDKLHGDRMQSC